MTQKSVEMPEKENNELIINYSVYEILILLILQLGL